MKRNSIGFIVIMATVSVVGILLIQFFFLKNSYDLSERQFHQLTTSALRNVAVRINEYNAKLFNRPAKSSEIGQVEQISNNYYVVNVNDVIDPVLVGHFLRDEFTKRNLNVSYEYAIYDCNSQKMVYGNVVRKDSIGELKIKNSGDTAFCSDEEMVYDKQAEKIVKKQEKKKKDCNLPTCEKYTYYFGVHFPDRSQFYNARLMTWYLMNGVLFFVVIFFGYALYIIIKQKQLSEIQKNFINNLTHEFKTPIASIELASKVLESPNICEQPGRLTEYVKIVGQQNKRLSAHVEKLLQMATIEKTKLQLNLEKIELIGFIEDAVNEFKSSQNGRIYEVSIESELAEAIILADKLHFSNLIFNILDNAIKYCNVEPEIIIKIVNQKSLFVVLFEDNGIGIQKADRKKIFQRFYRVPTGNVHDVKGFGLGLDYVLKIVRRHGWRIKVDENSRKGSTFIIEIKKSV